MIDTLASAFAAADLGYHGAAAMIREQQLGPRAIARLFNFAAGRGSKMRTLGETTPEGSGTCNPHVFVAAQLSRET